MPVFAFSQINLKVLDEDGNAVSNADVSYNNQIFTTDGFDIDEAAYMKNGVWYNIGFFPGTIPKNSWFGTGLAISPNSKYITGQITTSDTRSYPYIYNTETKTLTKITNTKPIIINSSVPVI